MLSQRGLALFLARIALHQTARQIMQARIMGNDQDFLGLRRLGRIQINIGRG